MAHGMGLGKPRTKLGRYLDSIGRTQGWLERHSGVSETTITKMCGNVNFEPSLKLKLQVVTALRNEIDPHIKVSDFW